jgi:GSH-dependent disulfide-bond oxidoreductase
MFDDGNDEPLTFYFWPTSNGLKVSIMLEELNVPFEVKFVDPEGAERSEPSFLAVAPSGRIPALVDPEGPDGKPLALFESDAILHFLARKYGAFFGESERVRADVDQWLFWQASCLGPAMSQADHFRSHAPDNVRYAFDHLIKEVEYLLGVVDRRLSDRPYLAVDYSIADIASFAWVRNWKTLGIDLGRYKNVETWLAGIAARPAVVKGLALKAPEAASQSFS